MALSQCYSTNCRRRRRRLRGVDHNAIHAPEDHLVINLRAAWHKLNRYYLLLDNSPAYYAACCLTLAPCTSSIRDTIAAIVNTEQAAEVAEMDQLERWWRFEWDYTG
jgi:hypothetical protein